MAAFSMFTGEKVWEFLVSEYVHGTSAYSDRHRAVAFGANDGKLYLIDSVTGEQRWEFATQGHIKEAPVFDEKRSLIYFAGFDGLIRAVDVETGKQVWAISTPNFIYATPLLHDDKLFIGSTDKYLHVVELERESHLKIDIGSKTVCSPVIIDKKVFVGANSGAILEIDAVSNEIVGKHQLPDPVTCRIASCADTGLFFASTYMNRTYAFRRKEN